MKARMMFNGPKKLILSFNVEKLTFPNFSRSFWEFFLEYYKSNRGTIVPWLSLALILKLGLTNCGSALMNSLIIAMY